MAGPSRLRPGPLARAAARLLGLALVLGGGAWLAGPVWADDARLAAPVWADDARLPEEGWKAERVVVRKGARELVLLREGRVMRRYDVALGFAPKGPKRERGDGRTPEGEYVLHGRNAQSKFHRSLRISYPNEEDRARAESRGVHPGGEIMIHGLPEGREEIGSDHTTADWTDGCVAVTNEEMDEIWERVDDGTPIEIRP